MWAETVRRRCARLSNLLDCPAVDSSPAIALRQVRFQHAPVGHEPPFELKVPTLTVARGERVAVVGPSGAGKSTLAQLIAGIRVPQEGEVEVEGVRVSALSDAQRRAFRVVHLGLVFQKLELLDYLSVYDNVLLPYRIHPTLTLEEPARLRARQLLEEAGLTKLAHRRPGVLSQGEQQRVAVCRALVTRAPLILADEPTGHLDERTAGRVMDLLFHRLQPDHTLVMITHDRSLLSRFTRTLEVEAP